jgi:hypothetical protein
MPFQIEPLRQQRAQHLSGAWLRDAAEGIRAATSDFASAFHSGAENLAVFHRVSHTNQVSQAVICDP